MYKINFNGTGGIEAQAETFVIANRSQEVIGESNKNLVIMVIITSNEVDTYLDYLDMEINEVIIYDEDNVIVYQSNSWTSIQNVMITHNGTLKKLIAELRLVTG